jgi:ATP-binding cassette subfamily F protein 3
MIDINNLSIQFGGKYLFEDVYLRIAKTDKVALVGSNGTGKSTFLKLLYGSEQSETGAIQKQRGIKIGFLPQEFIAVKGKTVFHEIKSSLTEINQIISSEENITSKLSRHDLSEEERISLLHYLGELTHRKEEVGFYEADSNIEKVLSGLGFNESDFFRKTDEFSGGWQMRIELAKILLGSNDLILLDEPTNHLDIDSLEWVIDFLNNYKGALLVVSHDKHFVNKVTNKTLEIFNAKLNFFNGNYDAYLLYKEERDEQLKAVYKSQQKKIADTMKFIERFRYKATKARQVQSRIKQLEKIDAVTLAEDEKTIDLKFPEPERSGAVPVELIDISKSYGENEVIRNLSLQVERGEKIALLGPNGSGKTTLSRIVAGKLEINGGKVVYGHNTSVSYYAQEVTAELDLENDIIDEVASANNEFTIPQLRTLLGSFLFSDDDVFKKIKVLSGGEKSRVALAKILLTKANLIILDEPTNHLDYSSKTILQRALINFPGTLLIVSHDIDFLRPVISKVVYFRDGKTQIYHGGIDYYLSKRKEDEQAAKEPADLDDRLNKKDQKRIEAEIRQKKYLLTKDIKQEIMEIESEIEKLEELKILLESELTKEEVYSNPETAKAKNLEYENTKQKLELSYTKWTALNHNLEETEKSFSV